MNGTRRARRWTRSSLLIAVIAVMVMALAACGGAEVARPASTDGDAEVAGPASTDGDASTSGEEEEEEEEEASTGRSGVTLSVWVMGDSGSAFEELVAGFTEQTGIGVDVEPVPWDNVNDKLTTAVASGSGPDVAQIGLSLLPQFQEAGALLDLSDYVDAHPGIASDNFVEAAAEMNVGGQMLSIPWVSDTRVLFYRSDILEEAGFDGPPATWDELHDMAVELAARGDGQYGYYIPQWDRPLPVIFTWQAGGEVAQTDTFLLDTPELREAVEFYTSFHTDGAAPLDSDFDQTLGFVTGVTPMVISGPYLAKSVADQAPELDGSWAVALLPKNQNRTSLFAGSNLGVWHNTEHADEAVQLLEYLSQAETQLRWYENVNELPTVTAALEDDTIASDPLASVYVEQLQHSRPLPLHPEWDAANAELLNALNESVLNGVDIDTALKQLNARVQQPAG